MLSNKKSLNSNFDNNCTTIELGGEIPKMNNLCTFDVVGNKSFLLGSDDMGCNHFFVLEMDKMRWTKFQGEIPISLVGVRNIFIFISIIQYFSYYIKKRFIYLNFVLFEINNY